MEGVVFNFNLLAQADNTTYVMMGGGVALLIYITLRPWLNKQRRRTRDPLENAPLRLSMQQQKSIERDMQNLLVELHEMARHMSAQIETRVAKLELLMSEADEKIEKLHALQAAAGSVPVRAPASASPANEPAIDQPVRLPVNATRAVEPNIEAPLGRHAEIYRLADEGLDVRTIEQRTGRPSGEIEVILALRPRPRAPIDGPDEEVSEPPAIASA